MAWIEFRCPSCGQKVWPEGSRLQCDGCDRTLDAFESAVFGDGEGVGDRFVVLTPIEPRP
jgi:hypothetical protein